MFNPVGGPYHSVKATAMAFHREGNEVSILGTKDHPSQDSSALEFVGVPEIKIRALRKWGPYNFHFSTTFGTYWRAVKEVDCVSLQGVWMLNCLIVAFFALLQNKPYYFAIRGEFNDPGSLSSLDKKIIKPIISYLFNRSNFLQVLNPREEDALRLYGVRVPIKVIPNGIDIPELEVGIKKEKIVLFIGRIHPMKGLSELIQAWNSVGLPGWKLVIAGDGEEGHKKEILGKAVGNESIEFIGRIMGESKVSLLRKSMWFVLPSYMEGMPMAVLEAMSYKLPVMITDECNLPMVFTANAGLKVNTTVESIVTELKYIESMDSEYYHTFANQAKKLVEDNFKWENVVVQVLSSFKTE